MEIFEKLIEYFLISYDLRQTFFFGSWTYESHKDEKKTD